MKSGVEFALLVGGTIAAVLLAIDRWVHARESREASLEFRTTGRASLQSQIDSVCKLVADREAQSVQNRAAYFTESTRHREEQERLRLERAGVLAHELASIHQSIERLHADASDHGTRQQVQWGQMERRVQIVELRQEELFRLVERRIAHQPRKLGERREEP